MSQLKKKIQNKLKEDLQKIDIHDIKDYDIILDEKPDLFFPDARTIFVDGEKYHILAKERGIVTFDKVYDSLERLMYELLDDYVIHKASDIAWNSVNGDFKLYAKCFDEEKIKLFTLINPEYGRWKEKEIEEIYKGHQ